MSRLSCPSMNLKLGSLFRRTRHIVWIAFGLAIGLHGVLSQVDGFREKEAATKPLTTQFVKRQPRLTKPLEMRKRPEPKRRRTERRVVSVRPQATPHRESTSIRLPQLLPILARPDVAVSRMHYTSVIEMEPEVVAQEIVGTRQAKSMVDMSLEMLDIDALDYGRYSAMVIQDPNDKRNIRGFLHFSPFFLSGDLLPPSFIYYGEENGSKTASQARTIVESRIALRVNQYAGLIRSLNEMTEIKASFLDHLVLDSGELFDMPWVYLHVPYYSPAYTEQEKMDVGRYMLTGGFIFTDTWHSRPGVRSEQDPSQRLLREALSSQGYGFGRDWTVECLPKEHSICHSFFDFGDGPPKVHVYEPYCSVVNIDERIVCLLNNQYYNIFWEQASPSDYVQRRQWPAIRFTINTIIFALTQEGSIAQRVMDSVSGY